MSENIFYISMFEIIYWEYFIDHLVLVALEKNVDFANTWCKVLYISISILLFILYVFYILSVCLIMSSHV